MKKDMIKVSIFYPSGEGKTFDMDYYCNNHVPMVGKLLGESVTSAAVEKGLSGGTPDVPPIYAAIGNLYFNSVESFQNSFGPHANKIMADMPNYTNIEPIIQISEVVI